MMIKNSEKPGVFLLGMLSRRGWFCAVFALILIQFICSCGLSPDSNQIPDLETIYQLGSQSEFDRYLIAWQQKSRPIGDVEIEKLSGTEKDIYEIYQRFYNPTDLDQYCATDWCPEVGSKFYTGFEYYVVQNEVSYNVGAYEDHNTLVDFRPNIVLGKNILYLSDEYIDELTSFLDIESHKEDIESRMQFLNKKISIREGHWVGWHFLTHPEVQQIDISDDHDDALVYFRIGYEGGEAKLRKNNDAWEMYAAYLTWIE